jgi:hypothetical protein
VPGQVLEELLGVGTEHVDHVGIELRPAAGSGDLHGDRHPTPAVVHLGHVRDVPEPDRDSDVGSAHPRREDLAVPAGEDLLQRVADIGAEPEPTRHVGGDLAVCS